MPSLEDQANLHPTGRRALLDASFLAVGAVGAGLLIISFCLLAGLWRAEGSLSAIRALTLGCVALAGYGIHRFAGLSHGHQGVVLVAVVFVLVAFSGSWVDLASGVSGAGFTLPVVLGAVLVHPVAGLVAAALAGVAMVVAALAVSVTPAFAAIAAVAALAIVAWYATREWQRVVPRTVPLLGDSGEVEGVIAVVRDATGEEMAAGSRQEAAAQRMLVEWLPVVTYVRPISEEGTHLFLGPGVEHVFGYSTEEWAKGGDHWQAMIHPEDAGRVLEAWQGRLGGPGWRMAEEYRMRTKDGREVWVREEAALIEPAGEARYVGGVILDITEQRRAEEQQRESEQSYRNLFENADFGIFRYSASGAIIEVNPAFARMYGYDSPEEVASTVMDIASAFYVHPERRNEFMRAAIEENRTVSVENEYRRKDGSTFTGQLNLRVARDSFGQVSHVDGFVQDISERKRAEQALRNSEQRFRAVFEAAQDAIYLKDRDLRYLQVNPATERLFLFSSEEIVGRTARELFGPEYVEAVDAADLRALAGEVYEQEVLLPRKNGTMMPLSIIRVPLRDQNGDIIGVCAIARDVSERRRLEEQLRQAQKMETVGRLAGGIAHDFNNLLTAITANAEFARSALRESDPAWSDIEQVKQAAQKAGALTRQLLAFSRRQVIAPKVLNLNDMILDMDRMLRRLIGADIEFVTIPGEQLGAVRADPAQMEQVLLNLVVNARDATRGGGTIAVETRNASFDGLWQSVDGEEAPGDYVCLVVRDTGSGIAPEVREHLFEPFYSTKGPGEGTGLGLATVYGIVRQHGGHIQVDTAVGRGSAFSVYMPRVSESVDRTARDAEGIAAAGAETVLVVEDEPAVRRVAVRVLRHQGYQVLEAATGQEALSLADQFPGRIHMLLTDIVMPQMSGRQLAETLRPLRPDMAVLFVSGYSHDAAAESILTDERTSFLQKPFTTEGLARKVRDSLDIFGGG